MVKLQKSDNMKIRLVFITLLLILILSGCTKTGCDDCTYQKAEFCKAMYDVNCNSAFLTTNIDNLIKSCGKDEADKYIDSSTKDCTQGKLECISCD